jgi:hypothetical protein
MVPDGDGFQAGQNVQGILLQPDQLAAGATE